MDSMTNFEPLHDDIIKAIINGYEQGLDIVDLFEQFDGSVDMPDIEAVYTTYEESVMDDDFDHDDDYDVDSAMGSIGWGTDEYYEAY